MGFLPSLFLVALDPFGKLARIPRRQLKQVANFTKLLARCNY